MVFQALNLVLVVFTTSKFRWLLHGNYSKCFGTDLGFKVGGLHLQPPKAKVVRGARDYLPQEILKIRSLEMQFLVF